ncbi:MAG: serine/threonine protein kinase [Myxococcales bacterium]|nr:serine/threonine protein kinase [Myxococcales bacterium]
MIAGRYRCVRLIGRGGFAEVYLAEDLRLGNRRVALKVLVEHVAYDQDRLQKFRQEAEIIGHLTNPYTVRAFDYGYDEHNRYYIAMEFVQGETLHELLKRQERFSVDRALEISIQILDALEEAHQMGIIHRDLKPKNIMISPQRQGEMVKVLDFGVARILRQADENDEWTLVGTATYMAPEQAQGMPISPASDIYSVGVVLYHMLSGRPPFLSQEDPVAVMIHHATKPVMPLRELRPELHIPEDVDQVVLKSLDKQPQYRYQQAGTFREALERALAHYLEVQYGDNDGDSTLSTSITLQDVEEGVRAQAEVGPPQIPSSIQSGEIRSQAALLEDLRSGSVPLQPMQAPPRLEDSMASTFDLQGEGIPDDSMVSTVDVAHNQPSTDQHAHYEDNGYIDEDEDEQPTQRLSGLQEAPEKTAVRKTPTAPSPQITNFDLLTPDFAAIEEISVNEQAAGTRSGYYAASGDALPAVRGPALSPMGEKAKTSPRQVGVFGLQGITPSKQEEEGDETALSLQGVGGTRPRPAVSDSPTPASGRPSWVEEEIGAEEVDEMTYAEGDEILEEIVEDDSTLKPGVSSEELIAGAMQYGDVHGHRADASSESTSLNWASSEDIGDATALGGATPSAGMTSGAFVAGPGRSTGASPAVLGLGGSQPPEAIPSHGQSTGGYGVNGGAYGGYGASSPLAHQSLAGHSSVDDALQPMKPPISSLYPGNAPVLGGAAAQPNVPVYPIQPTTIAPSPSDPVPQPRIHLPETNVLPLSEVSPPRMPKTPSPMQDILVTGRANKLGRANDRNASTMELKAAFTKGRWFGVIAVIVVIVLGVVAFGLFAGESAESIAKRQAQQVQAEYLRSLQEGDRAVTEGRYRDALSSYKTALLHKAGDPTATKRMQQVMVDLQSMDVLRKVRQWIARKSYFRAYNQLLKVPQQSSLWDERNRVMTELKPSLIDALRERVRLFIRRRQWQQASEACVSFQRFAPKDRLIARCRRVWRSYPPPKEN